MAGASEHILYRAYRADGEIETGLLDAVDEADALRQLRRRGCVPFELSRRGPGARGLPATASRARAGLATGRLDLARFFAELSVMLEAGFTVDIAVRAVADAETDRLGRRRAGEIHARLTEGLSVAEAFAAVPEITDDVAALLASGEGSGRLDVVVHALAESFARRAARRREVTEALMYPAFLLVVMAGAVLLLSLYLAPALAPVFENSGVAAPAVIEILLGLGAFLSGWGVPLLAALGLGLGLLLLRLQRPAGRQGLAALLMRLPGLAAVIRAGINARYLGTMSLLLENGVPMLEAMRLAAATAATVGQRAAFLAARTRVSEGAPFWRALGGTGQIPEGVLALLRLGEESNMLAAMLTRASLMVDGLLQRRISRALAFLTPALTLLLGGLVGGLVVSVMTALLGINEIAIQ